jgi:hypothetical protein
MFGQAIVALQVLNRILDTRPAWGKWELAELDCVQFRRTFCEDSLEDKCVH